MRLALAGGTVMGVSSSGPALISNAEPAAGLLPEGRCDLVGGVSNSEGWGKTP